MLSSENLDMTRFGELFEQAVARIPALAPGWTDLTAHDPGITILETMALLADMQNYYVNTVNDNHILKYLALLGIRPKPLHPARVFVTADTPEREVFLPKGSIFFAEELPFETEQAQTLIPNRITAVFTVCGEDIRELTAGLERREGLGETVFATPGETLYIGFEAPFATNVEAAIYVRTGECKERMPSEPSALPLTDLRWETAGEKEWTAAQVRDETASLLFSGFVRFSPSKAMRRLELFGKRLYFMRVRVSEGDYDLPPVIKRMRLNTFSLSQQHTLVRSQELHRPFPVRLEEFCNIETTRLFVPCPIGFFEETSGNWHLEPRSDGSVWFHTDLAYPYVKLVGTSTAYDGTGTATGVSMQRLTLNSDNILPESLSLMLRGKDNVWRDCPVYLHPPSGKITLAGCLFLPESGELLFGDGRDFLIPETGPLLVTGLSCTRGVEGNAAAFSIGCDGVGCVNEDAAQGGTMAQTPRQALEDWKVRVGCSERAVNRGDYEEIALRTPGLVLRKAKAFPISLLRRGTEGLMVAVMPGGGGRPDLLPRARQKILEQLEPCRLLTVHIEVTGPRYLSVRVDLRVALWEDSRDKRGEITRRVRMLTDATEGEQGFGETVSHAKLFSELSALSFVRTVERLRLTATGGKQLPNGDILPEPDTLTWLEDCHLEVC